MARLLLTGSGVKRTKSNKLAKLDLKTVTIKPLTTKQLQAVAGGNGETKDTCWYCVPTMDI